MTGPIPTELTGMESLEILYFSDNLLSGTIPFKELSTMSSLSKFVLLLTQVDGFHLSSLNSTLPTFVFLMLETLSFSSPSVYIYPDFLFLQNNLFTGSLTTEIGNFYNLTALWLENNGSLEGSIPSEIGLLKTIQSLNLAYNKFNNQLPKELGLLTNLIELGLHNNTFSGTIITEFGLLTSLEALDLASNRFTGPIPSELGMLSNLLYLDLSGNIQLGGGTNEIPVELEVLCQNNFTTCFLPLQVDMV